MRGNSPRKYTENFYFEVFRDPDTGPQSISLVY